MLTLWGLYPIITLASDRDGKHNRIPGCGSAWLERLIWDQEVAGSNPVTPTMYDLHQNKTLFFEYESVAQLDRATAF